MNGFALCTTISVVVSYAQPVFSEPITELDTWLGGRRCTFTTLPARPTGRGEQVLSGRAAQRPGFRAGAAADWPAVGRWTRAALSELLANRTVPMLRGGGAGFLFAPKADKAQSTGKLADVFQSSLSVTHQPINDSAYIFSEVSAPAWGHRASSLAPILLGCIPNPPHAIGDVTETAQRLFFAVGNAGSGLGFHTHPAAWNVVLHGSKWWVVVDAVNFAAADTAELAVGRPTLRGQHTNWSRLMKLMDKGKLPGAQECVQRPGDLVYVPPGYQHAVVNLGDTIAVRTC